MIMSIASISSHIHMVMDFEVISHTHTQSHSDTA